MDTHAFNKKYLEDGEPIIIYGAGPYGNMTYKALEEQGIKPMYFCDKVKTGECLGIKIISPLEISKYKNAHILIASASHFYDIKGYLDSVGHKKYYNVGELISNANININDIPPMGPNLKFMIKHYDKVIGNINPNVLELLELSLIVTERCSLRCKDCGFLMQYYENQEEYSFDSIIRPFDKLLECIDYLYELVLVGGEPFMNKELYKIIDHYKDNDKIDCIVIVTNGTIVPNTRNLLSLKEKKVKVFISDYGKLSVNLKKLVEIFKNEGINYFVAQNLVWQEFGELKNYNKNSVEMKETFKNCPFRDCYAMLKSKLFRCSPSAHGTNLKIMPGIVSDFVDFDDNKFTTQEIRKRVYDLLFNKNYLEVCNYCYRDTDGLKSIPTAIQIDKPIPYKKIMD